MLSIAQIEQIYDDHAEKLYRFFFFKIRDQEAAEDLTSETFHQFIKKVKKTNVTEPTAFLYGIAQNLFKQFLRKKYQLPTCLFLEENCDFTAYLEDYIEQENQPETPEAQLQKYLPLLPDKQREVIELRLIQKLTPTEIAKKVQKNLNYVRTTQKRAIKNLRRIIACTP